MELPLYVVDAFTTSPFGGNPAAVCPLDAWLDDDWFTLDFPVRPLEAPDHAEALASQIEAACGVHPQKVTLSAGNCLAEYENEAVVRSLTPDPAKVLALDCKGLIITARGDDCDFVSRFLHPGSASMKIR